MADVALKGITQRNKKMCRQEIHPGFEMQLQTLIKREIKYKIGEKRGVLWNAFGTTVTLLDVSVVWQIFMVSVLPFECCKCCNGGIMQYGFRYSVTVTVEWVESAAFTA